MILCQSSYFNQDYPNSIGWITGLFILDVRGPQWRNSSLVRDGCCVYGLTGIRPIQDFKKFKSKGDSYAGQHIQVLNFR